MYVCLMMDNRLKKKKSTSGLRRVEIQVTEAGDPSHELRRLVGVLSREF
mgnify:CR=1 FL=1